MRVKLLNLSGIANEEILAGFPDFILIKAVQFNLEKADKEEVEKTFLQILEEYKGIQHIDYLVLPGTPLAACWIGYELAQNQKAGEALPYIIDLTTLKGDE